MQGEAAGDGLKETLSDGTHQLVLRWVVQPEDALHKRRNHSFNLCTMAPWQRVHMQEPAILPGDEGNLGEMELCAHTHTKRRDLHTCGHLVLAGYQPPHLGHAQELRVATLIVGGHLPNTLEFAIVHRRENCWTSS